MKLIKRGVLTYVESDETLIVRFQKTGGAREQKKSTKMFFFKILAVFFSETFHSGVFNYAQSDKIKFEKFRKIGGAKEEKNGFSSRFLPFLLKEIYY